MRRFVTAVALLIAATGAALAQGAWPEKSDPPDRAAAGRLRGRHRRANDHAEAVGTAWPDDHHRQPRRREWRDRVGSGRKAAPDGYTLGMATSTTHVTTAILNTKLPYDPVKDFVPVALIGIVPYVLTVSPSLPVKNLTN